MEFAAMLNFGRTRALGVAVAVALGIFAPSAFAQGSPPKPMTQDGLLGLFSSASTGRDVVLEPATLFDMCGRDDVSRPSLEVVYDGV